MVSAARKGLDLMRAAVEQTPRPMTDDERKALADQLAMPVVQADLFGKPSKPSNHPGVHHTCHWPGCTTPVRHALWGCKYHWFLLPLDLRNEIWRTYRPGQEVTKSPSREYIAAARRVQDWIATQGR